MKKKIVIIEDDPSITDALNIIFTRAGYDVSHYSDGAIILEGDIEPPDIFLIDRQLSGIDGLEICRFLKQHQPTAGIPIILMSATPGILNMAKNAGADDFIEKPFSKLHLTRKIEQYLGSV